MMDNPESKGITTRMNWETWEKSLMNGLLVLLNFCQGLKGRMRQKKRKQFNRIETKLVADNGRSNWKAISKGSKLNVLCFIYEGNYIARECPKKTQVNSVSMEKGAEDTTYASLMRVLDD